MKQDYTGLDAAILARIQESQPILFSSLLMGAVWDEAMAFESIQTHARNCIDFKPAWRFVDARLQALRKAGKIRYQRKPEGWVMCGKGGAA